MLITIFYSGLEVSQRRIMGKDVKIASRLPSRNPAPGPASSVEKVWFPSAASLSNPVRSQALSRLLPFLERGVLLACNPQGLFIQRLCQGRVFWSGPGAPHRDRPNKLDRQETLVQLFDSKHFNHGESETDGQTDRQTDRQTGTQTDRQTASSIDLSDNV
ncbi:UNVERIFIED_CONTAM: hypothetical protein FKN15_031009 [Acipenser sinensis]